MSPFFPSSSESLHPSQSGESLSEAFLDFSSRTRDSLPEQHRVHFDELRGSILAFCKEFKIPVDTLRSKEDFGKQLTSKKISQERLAEAVLLFARLEYLVTNKEPLKEKENPVEYADRLYHLSEQYTSQVSLLERVGILKDGTIAGIDGEEYPIPTLEQIAKRLYERREELSPKRDQGFTKLLLVPFGMSLDALMGAFQRFLLDYHREHKNFDLDIHHPLWSWKDDKAVRMHNFRDLIYYPTSFSEKYHQGQTKEEILEKQATDSSSFPGWSIQLLQPGDPSNPDSLGFALIPKEREGKIYGKKNPRPDIENCLPVHEYLSLLQEVKGNSTSPYHGESGMTPEDWMMAFMTQLVETGKPLDSHKNNMEGMAYLVEAFFPFSDCPVPSIYWDSTAKNVTCDSVVTDCQGLGDGARFLVTV